MSQARRRRISSKAAPCPARALGLAAIAAILWQASAFADPPPTCDGHDLSALAASRGQELKHAEETRSDWLVNAKGLLWRIEKPGVAPSYLFGTIHSTDERAIALAHKAATEIHSAKVVLTELGGPLDKGAMAELGANLFVKALDKENDTLQPIASSDDRENVEKYVATRGINADLAHHLKLWFLAATTAAPLCESQRQAADLPIVDNVVAQTAKDLGVKVVALETLEEQADALAALKPEDAATILSSAAKRPSLEDDAYTTLLDFYVKSEPVEAMPVIDATGLMTPEEIAAGDRFAVLLLKDRNRVMVERAAPMVEAGGAFIAVGAFHLSGKEGLVALLKSRGFTLTPLW